MSTLFVGVALAAPAESEPSRVGTNPTHTERTTSTTRRRDTTTSTSTTASAPDLELRFELHAVRPGVIRRRLRGPSHISVLGTP